MASNSEDLAESAPKLSELFDIIWKDYEFLENTTESSNSDVITAKVQLSIENAEKAVRMVNQLDLFSMNERLEEVATNELKYLLLPGLLGYFTYKSTKESRLDVVKKCQVYYIDFVRLCKMYGISDVDLPKPYSVPDDKADPPLNQSKADPPPKQSHQPNLEEQMRRRQLKIERFKNLKEVEKNLNDLYSLMKKDTVDEETKRDYYITLLKRWIFNAIEACESIDEEIPLLEYMLTKNKSETSAPQDKVKKVDIKKPVFRPFIITKDVLQKQVFGLGYPGVPTFTVDEFYQKRVEEGLFPAEGTAPKNQNQNDPNEEARQKEKAAKEKEKKEEEDDEDTLRKARQWDEWKDDHRRGWGNMHNKG